MAANDQSNPTAGFILGGTVLGGAIGFLMRPSNLLTGQLDFGTVITRRRQPHGLDALLKTQAEQSFNTLVLAALIGAGVGYAIAAARRGRERAGRLSRLAQPRSAVLAWPPLVHAWVGGSVHRSARVLPSVR